MVIFYKLKKDCQIKEQGQFLVCLIKNKMIVTTMKHFYHCLLDTYITCILNYGCEVWGYHTAPAIEKGSFIFS
jgi:hypothetical protein